MRLLEHPPKSPFKWGIHKHKNPGQNGGGIVLTRASTQILTRPNDEGRAGLRSILSIKHIKIIPIIYMTPRHI